MPVINIVIYTIIDLVVLYKNNYIAMFIIIMNIAI